MITIKALQLTTNELKFLHHLYEEYTEYGHDHSFQKLDIFVKTNCDCQLSQLDLWRYRTKARMFIHEANRCHVLNYGDLLRKLELALQRFEEQVSDNRFENVFTELTNFSPLLKVVISNRETNLYFVVSHIAEIDDTTEVIKSFDIEIEFHKYQSFFSDVVAVKGNFERSFEQTNTIYIDFYCEVIPPTKTCNEIYRVHDYRLEAMSQPIHFA